MLEPRFRLESKFLFGEALQLCPAEESSGALRARAKAEREENSMRGKIFSESRSTGKLRCEISFGGNFPLWTARRGSFVYREGIFCVPNKLEWKSSSNQRRRHSTRDQISWIINVHRHLIDERRRRTRKSAKKESKASGKRKRVRFWDLFRFLPFSLPFLFSSTVATSHEEFTLDF